MLTSPGRSAGEPLNGSRPPSARTGRVDPYGPSRNIAGRLHPAVSNGHSPTDDVSSVVPDTVLRLGRDGTCLDLKLIGSEPPYGSRDVIGRGLFELLRAEDAATVTGLVDRALQTGDPQAGRYRQMVDDQVRDFHAVVIAAGQDEAIALVTDVTARRQQYQQTLLSQRMEAIGHLAGGVAHDFSNLLTAIIGQCQLASQARDGGEAPDANLTEIRKAAQRGTELVGRLMSFSRRRAPEVAVVDVNDLVLNATALLDGLIGEDVELVTETSADPGVVRVDPDELELVLLNLVANARDALPEGGVLRIEATNVDVTESSPEGQETREVGPFVALRVSDNGIGMTRDVTERIFEPFFTTKAPGSGTGLGLPTCESVVSQYGGFITVQSEPWAGTTFTVHMPLAYGPLSPDLPFAEAGAVPRGGKTVLLVEDEEAVHEVTAAVLRGQGYTVIEATDGIEAWSLTRGGGHRRIDLLFTDVIMPSMRGGELAALLRAIYPNICVLFTSGYGGGALGSLLVPQDRTAFIEKPFTPSELALQVRAVLEN